LIEAAGDGGFFLFAGRLAGDDLPVA